MKIALLVNRESFDKYSKTLPDGWEGIHLGNGVPDADALAATGAEAMVVDAMTKIDADIIGRMPKLKLIHSQGVAYNGIDTAAADAAGVYVCNNAGVNDRAVAEQAILLILALLKNFRSNEDAVYAGRQIETKTAYFMGGITELGSCHVGVVGMGAIGRALAERLAAFGCRLSYFNRTQKPDCGVPYLPLEELYAECDVVSLHVPVSPETENMVNAETLKKFKRGAILVNTARGELMDHEAVVAALVSGQLGGLAADTLAPEPVLLDNPVIASLPVELRSRVALSPHVGGITADCFIRSFEHIWENIAALERGERPDCVVNKV
ncbi:MAG: hypothetical protein LBN99_07970 [Oscillospiraceae bacterium]|jgi:lactate dehydrogenase-like 2-hydroxyacid dehydrogenase|nr:hypothetical protein [Oscillospiraceae bacterium]